MIRDMGGFINDAFGGIGPILLPLVIAGLGIVFSILGTLFIRVSGDSVREAQVQAALNKGNWTSIILTGVALFFILPMMLPATMEMSFFGEGIKEIAPMGVFYAVLVGLAVGGLISYFTEYYTGLGKKPVLDIVTNSATGAATNIIAGLSTGMMSTFAPILLFAGAIWATYTFAGFYGVSIAGLCHDGNHCDATGH